MQILWPVSSGGVTVSQPSLLLAGPLLLLGDSVYGAVVVIFLLFCISWAAVLYFAGLVWAFVSSLIALLPLSQLLPLTWLRLEVVSHLWFFPVSCCLCQSWILPPEGWEQFPCSIVNYFYANTSENLIWSVKLTLLQIPSFGVRPSAVFLLWKYSSISGFKQKIKYLPVQRWSVLLSELPTSSWITFLLFMWAAFWSDMHIANALRMPLNFRSWWFTYRVTVKVSLV